MWIKRKEFKEMKKEIRDLRYDVVFSNSKYKTQLAINETLEEIENLKSQIKANTSKANEVTLQELAEYILDNKPIVREEEVKIKIKKEIM